LSINAFADNTASKKVTMQRIDFIFSDSQLCNLIYDYKIYQLNKDLITIE